MHGSPTGRKHSLLMTYIRLCNAGPSTWRKRETVLINATVVLGIAVLLILTKCISNIIKLTLVHFLYKNLS